MFGNHAPECAQPRNVRRSRVPHPRYTSCGDGYTRHASAPMFDGIQRDTRQNRRDLSKRTDPGAWRRALIEPRRTIDPCAKTKRCEGRWTIRTVSQRRKGETLRESVLNQETRPVLAEPCRCAATAAPRCTGFRVAIFRRQRATGPGGGSAYRTKTEFLRRNVEFLDFGPDLGDRLRERPFAFLADLYLKLFELRCQLPVGRHMDGIP